MRDKSVVSRLKPGVSYLLCEFLDAQGAWGKLDDAQVFAGYLEAEAVAKLPEHRACEPWPMVLEEAQQQEMRHREFLANLPKAVVAGIEVLAVSPRKRRGTAPRVASDEVYRRTAERAGERVDL